MKAPAGAAQALVEVVRHRELPALVERMRSHPDRFPVLPIDARRAALHAANPDADPEDPALLLVLVDGRCRGYLGLTPQFIARDGGVDKVLAFSTLLVDAPLRGSGIADRLLECARGFGPLLTIGNSNAAQGFFRKRGLRELPPCRVVYLPLGPGHGLSRLALGLGKRLRKRGYARLATATAETAERLRPLLAGSRRRELARLRNRLRIDADRSSEACDRVPAALAPLLATAPGRVLWRVETVNWLLDENRRSAASAGTVEFADGYHFRFDDAPRAYRACLLRERDAVRGLAVFHCHRIHGQWTVSILKAFVPDSGWLDAVVAFALRLASEHAADVIRGGAEFEEVFARLRPGQPMIARTRIGYADAPSGSSVFDAYQESFADGDIALY